MNFKLFIFFLYFNISLSLANEEIWVQYQVKKGDELGVVLSDLGLCPIWGDNGSAQRTLKANGNKNFSIGSFILVPKPPNSQSDLFEITSSNIIQIKQPGINFCNSKNKIEEVVKNEGPVSFQFAQKLFEDKKWTEAVQAFKSIRNEDPHQLAAWIYELRALKELSQQIEWNKVAKQAVFSNPSLLELEMFKGVNLK